MLFQYVQFTANKSSAPSAEIPANSGSSAFKKHANKANRGWHV